MLSVNSASALVSMQDTITTNLPEVEVEAENQKMGHNFSIYYLDEKTKQFSMDAIDMLRRMGISELLVNPMENSVTTNNGDGVAIYINYIKANQYDLTGLRCSDVLRVEYIDAPTDPRFDGASHVVNIFTKIYIYGGYTKLTGNYKFSEYLNPNGNIFSKFSFKKTTLDAYLGSTYFNNRHMRTDEVQTYKFPEQEIERHTQSRDGHRERTTLPVSLRMIQTFDRMTIENNLSYSFSNISRHSSHGSLNLMSEMNDRSYSYSTSAPAINRSFIWDGIYRFNLPKYWSLSICPTFKHTHNNTSSHYESNINGSSPIKNNAQENANSILLSVVSSKSFRSRHYITMQLIGEIMKSRVEYLGSRPAVMDFSDSWARANVYYYVSISDNLSFNADLSLQNNTYKTNQYREIVWTPTANAQVIFSGRHNNRLYVHAHYGLSVPTQNLRSTNIQQSNEFLYFTGNPFLGNSRNVSIGGGYNQMLSKNVSVGLTTGYNVTFNVTKECYSLYDNNNALLRSYWNNGNYHQFYLTANLTGRFLSNSMTVQISPGLHNFQLSGSNHFSHTPIACSFNVNYYLDRFSFRGWYSIFDPGINYLTGAYTRYPDYYGIEATCAIASWHLKLTVSNPFSRTKRDSRTVMNSPLYSYVLESYTGNYNTPLVGLTAVYTFGYGKRLNDRSELTAPQDNSSLILTK